MRLERRWIGSTLSFFIIVPSGQAHGRQSAITSKERLRHHLTLVQEGNRQPTTLRSPDGHRIACHQGTHDGLNGTQNALRLGKTEWGQGCGRPTVILSTTRAVVRLRQRQPCQTRPDGQKQE